MNALSARIAGIGFWAQGLPSWAHACAFVADGTVPEAAAARPAPQLLAANERRRAPQTVAVALDVALAACRDAGRDPASLPSVFASTHGELAITDYMCDTLARDPTAISPTRFHNSVHNAAAGYWTIGNGCTAPATAISAGDASFAQGLLEAVSQLQTGADAVLLVGYDGGASGPLASVVASDGLLGGALLLVAADAGNRCTGLTLRLHDGQVRQADGALVRYAAGNAMAPMLPLFQALADGGGQARLPAGASGVLHVEIDR